MLRSDASKREGPGSDKVETEFTVPDITIEEEVKPTTRKEKIAWLAGLLEGEGSFFLNRDNIRKRIRPCVRLEMTDKEILLRASKIVGEFLSKKPLSVVQQKQRGKWAISYRIAWLGTSAKSLIALLLPYLGRRRKTQIARSLVHRPRG